MTPAPHALSTARLCEGDIIDADYVIVAPPEPREIVPGVRRNAPAGGLDPLRRLSEPDRRSGAGTWMAALGVAALSFWVAGGHALVPVGQTPAPATHAAIRSGMTLVLLDSRTTQAGGRAVLEVETAALNANRDAREMPAAEITVVARDGTEARYPLGATAARIEAGARQRFVSRLALPPAGVRRVGVAFAPAEGALSDPAAAL